MPDVSRSTMRGLVLAREIEIWPEASNYDEQIPIPGPMVAQQTSRLAMWATGTPTGTADLELRIQHGGLPSEIDQGATYAVRRTGETLWLGYEVPGHNTGWEGLYLTTGVVIFSQPCTASLADGTVVVVAKRDDGLYCYSRNATTGVWSGSTVDDGTYACYWPALFVVPRPDGVDEVYCLAWKAPYASAGLGEDYRMGMWRSLDGGATWALVQDWCTTEGFELTPSWTFTGYYYLGRIRAAYRDGELSVFAHIQWDCDGGEGYADYVYQWASGDIGTKLTLIGSYNEQAAYGSGKGWGCPDVVATADGFRVAWLVTDEGVWVADLGNAWQPLDSAQGYNVYDGDTGNGYSLVHAVAPEIQGFTLAQQYGLALAQDPAGITWVFATRGNPSGGAARASGVVVSLYLGADLDVVVGDIRGNWMFDSVGGALIDAWIWYPEDLDVNNVAENGPQSYGACFQRGRVILAHDWYADVFANPESLAVAYVGGWSDLTMPNLYAGTRLGERGGWYRTWLPYELPDDQNYTTQSGGTSSVSIISASMVTEQITTGDGALNTGWHYYEWSPPGASNDKFLQVEADVTCVTGGFITTEDIALTLRVASATNGCEISIRFTGTQVRLYDVEGAATLDTVTGLTAGTLYTWRVGLYQNVATGAGRTCQVWYRATDCSEKRRWTRVGDYTLTDGVVGGVAPLIQWGHIANSGGVTQNASKWRRVLMSGAQQADVGDYGIWHDLDQTGGDNPGKLPGRPLGRVKTWAMDGFEVAGESGPGLIGEEWASEVRGEHSIDRGLSLITPSPQIPWRATDDTTMQLAFAVDPDNPGSEDHEHPPLMALGAYGITMRRLRLDSRSAAGVWTTRIDTPTDLLTSVQFTRTGRTLTPGDATAPIYLQRDELAGWYARLSVAAPPSITYRRIAGNDEGRWASTAGAGAEPKARIYLEEVDPADPTGAGTERLSVYPDAAVIALRGLSCTGWRIYLDVAYPTMEGYWQGKFFWGPVHIFGLDPSWGRGIELVGGHDIVEVEGRVSHLVDRALPRRAVTLAWDDGVQNTPVWSSGEVRWITPSTAGGTEPVASMEATAGSLQHALKRHGGRPLIYLPSMTIGALTTWLITRRDAHMLATIASGPTIQPRLGDELVDEVQRIAQVELVEVV